MRVMATALQDGILLQGESNPLATAVVDVDSKGTVHRSTFADLCAFARSIANALPPPAATSPRRIGILAEGGGTPLYASWVAVLSEQDTVVPLSTETSLERLRQIFETCPMRALLATDGKSAAVAANLASDRSCLMFMLDVRPLSKSNYSTKETHLRRGQDGQDAYVYHTSGSSGMPKAVRAGHASIMNRLHWMWQQWPFAPDDACCQRIDHIFVDFVAEVFGPLSVGVPVIVVPPVVRRNPARLADFIRVHRITRVTLVPTLARWLITAAASRHPPPSASLQRPKSETEHKSPSIIGGAGSITVPVSSSEIAFPDVRLWVLSGEPLTNVIASGLNRLSSPSAVILNLYGSTEVAADVTCYRWTTRTIESNALGDSNFGTPGSVPIGEPINGCQVEVFDTRPSNSSSNSNSNSNRTGGDGYVTSPAILHRIPPTSGGRVGELYVSGAGLARGYLGQPKETEESFPFYVWDTESNCYVRLRPPISAPPCSSCSDSCDGLSSQKVGEKRQGAIRFFRTGDLVSYETSQEGTKGKSGEEGSTLVYRGRADNQVKVHGQRLDLGEVDNALTQAPGVDCAAAVTLSLVDMGSGTGYGATMGTTSGDWDQRGYEGGVHNDCMVAAVVSPEVINKGIIIEECQRRLPSFGVPRLLVAVTSLPTLPGSGKVDRRAIKQIVVRASRQTRQNDPLDPLDGVIFRDPRETLLQGSEGNREGETAFLAQEFVHVVSHLLQQEQSNVLPAAGALLDTAADGSGSGSVNINGNGNGEKEAGRQGVSMIDEDSDFFLDLGISSVQAVTLLHEIHTCSRLAGVRRHLEGIHLIDLFMYPNARLLAEVTRERMQASPSASEECSRLGADSGGGATRRGHAAHEAYEAHDVLSDYGRGVTRSDSGCRTLVGRITIRPMEKDKMAETCALISTKMMVEEPLMSSQYRRCHAIMGCLGGAILRSCFRMMVKRNVRSTLRSGGRILTAIDDLTGQVVGFTVGIDMVASKEGAGFRSGDGSVSVPVPLNEESEGSEESEACADYPDYLECDVDATPLLQQTWCFLRNLPLLPVLLPVSHLVEDLMEVYIRTKGWAYETGEVLYLSETGSGPARNPPTIWSGADGADGRARKTGRMALGQMRSASGLQSAAVAEALEMQLLQDAAQVGFVRAFTICTNAVTVQVARDLGFQEVCKITPVQRYPYDHQYHRKRKGSKRREPCASHPPYVIPSPSPSPSMGCFPFARKAPHVEPVSAKGPFAGVPAEHDAVILFEKVLVRRVHDGLLLDENTIERPTARSRSGMMDMGRIISGTVSFVGGWKLIPVREASGKQYSEMVAILADALPHLAASGRAIEYMTDVPPDQEAFILVTTASARTSAGATRATSAGVVGRTTATGAEGCGGSDGPGDLLRQGISSTRYSRPRSHASSIVGCMSVRRLNVTDRVGKVERASGSFRSDRRGPDEASRFTSYSAPAGARQLLILALQRRWRYRGVGTAMVRRVLSSLQADETGSVYVSSLPERVGFYERLGFRQVGAGEWCCSSVTLATVAGECIMVHHAQA